MREKFRNFISSCVRFILNIIYAFIVLFFTFLILKLLFNIQMPTFSWWSATLFSDNKINSIITEVESSGHNIRKVQSIDAFGRVCTDVFANSGMATSCEYPPEERKNWTIEDYKKLLKDKK